MGGVKAIEEIASGAVRGTGTSGGPAAGRRRAVDPEAVDAAEDILRGTLFKKGLTAPMEVRQYLQAVGKIEQRVSKPDYLKRRRQLNPDVFK